MVSFVEGNDQAPEFFLATGAKGASKSGKWQARVNQMVGRSTVQLRLHKQNAQERWPLMAQTFFAALERACLNTVKCQRKPSTKSATYADPYASLLASDTRNVCGNAENVITSSCSRQIVNSGGEIPSSIRNTLEREFVSRY